MQDLQDRLAITALIQDWALWRDTGEWEKLRGTIHPDATMTATWFHGPFEAFIEVCQRRESRSQHFLGGTTVELRGHRAIAQTRMTIMVRGRLDGIEVDVACHGRFFDRVEKREGFWRIAKRSAIYEKDRLDLVDPGATLTLDQALLERFPEGYRHLAYVQTRSGAQVSPNLPTARGEALEKLLAEEHRDVLEGSTVKLRPMGAGATLGARGVHMTPPALSQVLAGWSSIVLGSDRSKDPVARRRDGGAGYSVA